MEGLADLISHFFNGIGPLRSSLFNFAVMHKAIFGPKTW